MSEETEGSARIEEALKRNQNRRLRQWARQRLWESRIKELFGTGTEERQRTVVANLGLLPDWDQEPQSIFVVELSETRHHPKLHPVSGRPLEAHEYSFMRAVARVIVSGDGDQGAVDAFLDEIMIRPGTRHWRELEAYIHTCGERPWGKGQNTIKARDIYREALCEVVERFEKHVLDDRTKSKQYWRDDEWSSKKLFRDVTAEARRISGWDLPSFRYGLGPQEYRSAKKGGVDLSLVTSRPPGGGYKPPPANDTGDPEFRRKLKAELRRRLLRLNNEHNSLVGRQKRAIKALAQSKKDLADRGYAHPVIRSAKVLPRDEGEIAKQRALYWQDSTGKSVTPSHHPEDFDPYMGSESLEMWDKERDRYTLFSDLTDREWQTLMVRYVLFSGEIPSTACTMGITPGAVRTYSSAAFKKLRQTYQERR